MIFVFTIQGFAEFYGTNHGQGKTYHTVNPLSVISNADLTVSKRTHVLKLWQNLFTSVHLPFPSGLQKFFNDIEGGKM